MIGKRVKFFSVTFSEALTGVVIAESTEGKHSNGDTLLEIRVDEGQGYIGSRPLHRWLKGEKVEILS
jgi:hypothetical protein